MNALIHANHYDRRGLVIHRWPNKITIANPGSLRVSVEDAIVGGLSDPRNVTLIKMFNLINIGDRAGSGIPNIFDVWHRQGWERPVLEERFNPDRTVLSLVLSQPNNKKLAIKSSDKEKVAISDAQKQEIIGYLTANDVAKASELSALLGVTPARVRVLLSQLAEAGIIIAEGGNRNRTYRLKQCGSSSRGQSNI